jgi:O-antigen ligase
MSFFKSILHTVKTIYQAKDFAFLLLSLALFLLPLSINLSTFTLFLTLGLRLIQVFFLKQKLFRVKALKHSSLIGLFFFIYILLNSIIQNTFYYTISIFENEFSHLLLLVLIPILLRKKEDNIILCYFLFLGLMTACLYVFVMSFVLNIAFNKEIFIETLDIHHTYLSIYILFLVNFLLVKLFDKKQRKSYLNKIIYLSITILSLAIIFILGSKVSMINFALIFGTYLMSTFSRKNALSYIIIFSILILSLFLFNKRIGTSYEAALDFRLEIWKESVKSIKEHPFFGNLKMPEKDILNIKHYLTGKYYFMDRDLNSHNQYLSFFLKYGIFGVLISVFFVINLIGALNKSTSKNTIKEVIGFITIVLITFYIENVLDRHHGVVFCTIFYNYYLVAIQNEDI